MAGSVNKVVLIGNLTRDPELRTTSGGSPVVDFSIATNEKYKDKNGNIQESVEFHNIVAWNGIAEVINRCLKKGSSVFIEGKLRTRSWEDGNVKKYRTEIIVGAVQFLDKVNGSRPPVEDAPAWADRE